MMRRLQSPEFIVMGALAALCGLFLALLLSAEFGAQSSGGEASLRTTQTPTPNLAKLRQTAVHAGPKHRAHRRAHRARRARAHAVTVAAPRRVANVQTPTSNGQGYAQTNQGQGSPVQQLSGPSKPSPAPAPVKRQPAQKPSGGGGQHTSTSFDDSG
jgi:hypothetical protein